MTSNLDKRSQTKSAASQTYAQVACEPKGLENDWPQTIDASTGNAPLSGLEKKPQEKPKPPFEVGVGEDFEIIEVPNPSPPDEPPSNGPFTLKSGLAAVVFSLIAAYIYEAQYIPKFVAYISDQAEPYTWLLMNAFVFVA